MAGDADEDPAQPNKGTMYYKPISTWQYQNGEAPRRAAPRCLNLNCVALSTAGLGPSGRAERERQRWPPRAGTKTYGCAPFQNLVFGANVVNYDGSPTCELDICESPSGLMSAGLLTNAAAASLGLTGPCNQVLIPESGLGFKCKYTSAAQKLRCKMLKTLGSQTALNAAKVKSTAENAQAGLGDVLTMYTVVLGAVRGPAGPPAGSCVLLMPRGGKRKTKLANQPAWDAPPCHPSCML